MADLNALLVNPIPNAVLLYANGLNDSRQIVGEMLLGDGSTRAFLLTSVPEPATVISCGAGLLVVVGACSDRSRAQRRGRRAEHQGRTHLMKHFL